MASLFAAAEYEAVEAVIVDINPILENEHVLEPFEETDVDIVVSYHDFSETPDIQDLELVIEHAAEYGDVVKVATMAESPDDALVLLAAIHSASEDGITIGGVAMGEIGQHTRAVAPLYGSKLAFAPLSENSENEIPSQLPLEELSRLIEGTEGPSTSVSLHEGLTNIPPERNTE